jgi:hypothetical protein
MALAMSLWLCLRLSAQQVTASVSPLQVNEMEPVFVCIAISNNTTADITVKLHSYVRFEKQQPDLSWASVTPWEGADPDPRRPGRVGAAMDEVNFNWVRHVIPAASTYYEAREPVQSPIIFEPGTYRLAPIEVRVGAASFSSPPVSFTVVPHPANRAALTPHMGVYCDMLLMASHSMGASGGVIAKPQDLDAVVALRSNSQLSLGVRELLALTLSDHWFGVREYAASYPAAQLATQSACTLPTGGMAGHGKYLAIRAQWFTATTRAQFDAATTSFHQLLQQYPGMQSAHDPGTWLERRKALR